METVEVTLKVPKAIVDFLKEVVGDVEPYMVRTLVADVEGGLDGDGYNLAKHFVRQYNLLPIFEQYRVTVSDYINPNDC